MNVLAWGLVTVFALVSVALISLYKRPKRQPICRKDGEKLIYISHDFWECPRCKLSYKIEDK